MFRKENGVTLVALVVTIIVLLILAGVTVSMVLGEDGIIGRAGEANEAQERGSVVDQASVAFASVRTEQVARNAGVADETAKVNYTKGMAVELAKSGAFNSVSTKDTSIYVQIKAGGVFYVITVTEPTDAAKKNAGTYTVETEPKDAAATGATTITSTATY